MSEKLIYLDNNATTALDPRVLAAMMPFLTSEYGNAASNSHSFGWRAKEAVEKARLNISSRIGAAAPSDVIFTSGATEAINLAILGCSQKSSRRHIITTQIEHKAVLDTCKSLNEKGFKTTYISPNNLGIIDPYDIRSAISTDTLLVSVIMANNEIGTIQDIGLIGKICRERNVIFHSDTTQAAGKIPLDVQNLNIDIASFSAHKIYGPKGIGCLYLDPTHAYDKVAAQIFGGGHERGLRSGTLNVPSIVGFSEALTLACQELFVEMSTIQKLRNHLMSFIFDMIPDVTINGDVEKSLPGLLNISFHGIDADSLLLEMSDVALSSGSACTSANAAPSHVLKAIGCGDQHAQASVRFGIGRYNTLDEIEYVSDRLANAVARLRSMTPRLAQSTTFRKV